jgi:uncharacterized protein (UPF0276 family)
MSSGGPIAAAMPIGFGIRVRHYDELLREGAPVPVLEAITENVIGRGGRPRALLERLRRDATILLHGVGLGIGGVDRLDVGYLRALRALADSLEIEGVSDHLCFGGGHGHRAHDLWPLPYTRETILHVVDRIRAAQDLLGRRLLLENVSSYVTYRASEIAEWTFLAEIVERADAAILLDVNNVVVSARNHRFDAKVYVDALPAARIAQIHLAGHSDRGRHLFDDHGSPVGPEVLALYQRVLARTGPVPTILERDDDVPPLSVLLDEVARIRAAAAEVVP